jgi:methionyl-tRNA formyltransferase
MAVADVEPERIFPGTTFVEYGRLLVECGGGSAIELLTVQPEGGKPISPSEFLNGYQLKDGERLG